MEDHTLQFLPTVKKEAVIDVTCWNESEFPDNLEDFHSLCPEQCMMGLSTDIKIEEMVVDALKVEEHLNEKVIITKEQEKAQQLKQPGTGKKVMKKKATHIKKLFKIAKDFAALYKDEVRLPSPFPRFRFRTIIQCPACMKPRNTRSRSEFLELLIHVQKRHPASCNLLFTKISELYGPLIERMKTKIYNRTRKNYSIRLRGDVH